MNNLILRTLTPRDKPMYRRLMAQAFERGHVVQEDGVWDEEFGSDVTGIWDTERLRAAVTIRPFLVHWPGAVRGTLAMGGIAGVATEIDARGRGYIDLLLRDSLGRMRDTGQFISALYPFAWAFYRKFGWDWVGEKRTLTLPLREIKSTPEGQFVREITSDEAQLALSSLYDQYSANYRGAFSTESHQWKSKLRHNDNRTTFVYGYFPKGGKELTAYLLWRYDAGNSDGGEVREMVATSPDGYRALLGFLHYLGTQCRTARVTLPGNNPIWSFIYHNDVKTQIEPTFQARVVDVCKAMEQLRVPSELNPESNCTLQIQDDAAPWNNGTFQVNVAEGKVSCLPIEGSNLADIILDIQAFSQAFWGMPSLEILYAAGRISVTNDMGFKTLTQLLPATPVWTMDYF